MHAFSRYQSHISKLLWTSLANMLTTATSSDPTPLSIGHAGTSAVSLQGVPSVTGVGHCGSKCCTRATSLTICRSIGGRTTDNSCGEGTGTTFHVTTMQINAIRHKQKGMQNAHRHHVCTCAIMQAHHCMLNHTQKHECACTIHTNASMALVFSYSV